MSGPSEGRGSKGKDVVFHAFPNELIGSPTQYDSSLSSPVRIGHSSGHDFSFSFQNGSDQTMTARHDVPFVVTARSRITSITAESWARLSPQGQHLADLPEIQRQEHVPNSAMVFAKPFEHLVVTRRAHAIHAGAQVDTLRAVQREKPQQIDLTSYELQVLEGVLLLHDLGHVPGSHATDRVFAAMSGAPQIGEWGYNEVDFHELHGAQALGKGCCSDRARELLGAPLYDDVLAVLTNADKRPIEEKIKTYGPFSPSLSEERLKVLHVLEDLLDRSSFVRLDYETGGYSESEVETARQVCDLFLKSICVNGDTVSIIKGEHGDPYRSLIDLRAYHFQNVPMHPTNGLVSAVLQWAVGEQLELNRCSAAQDAYQWVKDALFDGKYSEVFGQVWEELSSRDQCITNRIAPLVTLKKSDLSDRGRASIEKVRDDGRTMRGYPAGLVSNVTGGSYYDASIFELIIREQLKQRGFGDIPLFIAVAPRLDKEFRYNVTTPDGTKGELVPPSLAEHTGYVFIAAEAIDADGAMRDLGGVRDAVESILVTCGWLDDGIVPREKYNPRFFIDPLYKNVFLPAVDRENSTLHPDWMRRTGGGGLLQSSSHRSISSDSDA